ncbi:MAG: hypothetical protein HKL96_07160 [Phycisphaerales bacterium]|nr:hypothetical protein [Phycisphaerales bacterium]
MQAPLMTTGGYSAKVTMRLIIEGRSLAVSQAGPDMLILTEPATLPACEGEFELTIDATTRRWPASIKPQPQASRELKVDFGSLCG